jgi:uncharacterized membrane protein
MTCTVSKASSAREWTTNALDSVCIGSYAVLDGGHSHSAADVIDALTTGTGMHPPAYYLLLHWWVGLVGSGRMLLALPAHLWGVLTLLGLRRLANRVVPGRRAGLWAMLLLAVSPWFMGFSNLARPYALAVCLAVWSLDAALALHRQAPRAQARLGPRVAFVALSTAGLYVIYHYAFVLVWELALLLVLAWRLEPARRWRELRNLAGMGLAITLGFAPWIPRLLAHLELTGRSTHYFAGHVAPPAWLSATGQLLALFALAEAVRSPAVEVMLSALSLLGVCTLLLVLASLLSSSRGSPDVASSAFWISIPLLPALIIASDLWRDTHTIFITKTCFAFLPILILMVVRGWQHVSIPSVRRAGLGAWALLLGAASLSAVHAKATSVIPYEAAARHVRQRDTDAHLVVLSSPRYSCATPLLLSLRDAGVRRVRMATVSGDRLADLVKSATRSGEFTDVSLIALDVSCFTKRIWQQPYSAYFCRMSQRLAKASKSPESRAITPTSRLIKRERSLQLKLPNITERSASDSARMNLLCMGSHCDCECTTRRTRIPAAIRRCSAERGTLRRVDSVRMSKWRPLSARRSRSRGAARPLMCEAAIRTRLPGSKRRNQRVTGFGPTRGQNRTVTPSCMMARLADGVKRSVKPCPLVCNLRVCSTKAATSRGPRSSTRAL